NTLRENVLPVYRRLADRRGIAVSLNAIGVSARALQHYAEAGSRFEEALSIWRELGDHQAAARTLSNLAAVAFNEGDHARATKLYRECRGTCESIGDAAGAAWAINFEASVDDAKGDRDRARALYAQALAAFRVIRDAWGTGDTFLAMGHMTCAADPVDAERLFREAHAVFAASGDTRGLVRVIEAFVCLAARRGDPALALRLAGAAAAARQAIGIPLPPFERDTLERALEVVRRQTDAAGAGPWMEGWAMTPQEAMELALTCS
ncbi:MAG TPA: tetratricopeptide repeat protein, partial [Vicinamibacterales bacterium]